MTAADARAVDASGAGRTDQRPPDPPTSRRNKAFTILRPLAGPLVLVGMIAYFGALYGDRYLSKVNLVNNVLGAVAFLAIVAAGQTVVMVVGEFDLSVGGLAALASVSTGVLLATTTVGGDPNDPTNVVLALLLGLAVGLAGGLINGVLVSRLGILAFIATLATSLVYSNLAAFRVDGRPVYNLVDDNFVEVAHGEVLGIPNRVLMALGVGVVIWFLLDQTPLGRKMYAVGGNPDSVALLGDQRQERQADRLRDLRADRSCRRHPAVGEQRHGQSDRTGALDAAIDRRRVPRHGDVSQRPAQPAGNAARRRHAARPRERAQLLEHQLLLADRDLRLRDPARRAPAGDLPPAPGPVT